MGAQEITESFNKHALISCIVVTTVFMALRFYARVQKTQTFFPYEAEDLAMYLALWCFITMCSLYLSAMPTLYAATAVEAGLGAPWPTFFQDAAVVLKKFFAVQIFFWATLWSVKCSLMFMFQRLTGRVKMYIYVWRAVMSFVVLSFIGCVISHLLSCSSFHAWFTPGLCTKPRDTRAKAASLWFALAVDLLTDLMIMAVPIHILYNLQISRAQKYSVGVVFAVGFITIAVAVVRVISLNSGVTGGQVNTFWLILWAGIEGCAAIVTGCLPSFAVFIRAKVVASRATHTRTYEVGSGNKVMKTADSIQTWRSKSKARMESIELGDVEVGKAVTATSRPITPSNESTKGLVKEGIVVTHTWKQQWHTSESSDGDEMEGKQTFYRT